MADLLLDDRPQQQDIQIGKGCNRCIGRKQGETFESVRLLPEEIPKKARAFIRVMMNQHLAAIKPRRAGDGAQPETAHVFEAALFDQAGEDIKCFLEVRAILRFNIRDRPQQFAPAGYFAGKTLQKLLRPQVKIKIAAGIELRSHLLETGFFDRSRGRGFWRFGLCRRPFLLLASACGDKDQASQDESGQGC